MVDRTRAFTLSSPSIMSAITDVYIAIALCYSLHGAQTEYEDTRNIVSRLVLYTANRSLVLCLLHTLQVVLWSLPIDSVHGATSLIYYPESAVYFNSALVMLNARRHIRRCRNAAAGTHATDMMFRVGHGGSSDIDRMSNGVGTSSRAPCVANNTR